MTALLSEQEYYEKVYAGWLGKNIGGTLGAKVEGKMELLNLTYYPELPDGPLENDDLDLQLVWLHALEQYGPRLTARELGQEWLEHIFFPYDEYGYALANLRRGLLPPLTGSFNNPFNHCMGSPIRSEIWAMIAPGRPQIAAYYAYQDAIVDHAGGEGVYGEMFFAAIESAAFYEKDSDRLIQIGLSYIPKNCRTSQAVNSLLDWHKQGKTWLEARELILEHYGSINFTDAPQNIAFTILGWLYGTDFEDALLKAVNCGYDTDCTGATLGSILGIINGKEIFPKRWIDPIGDGVVVSPPIKGFPAPKNLDELTRRTMNVCKETAAYWDHVQLQNSEQDAESAQGPQENLLHVSETSPYANEYTLPRGSQNGLVLNIDYGKEGPAIGIEQSKTIQLSLTNRSKESWMGEAVVSMPSDWPTVPAKSLLLEPGCSMQWDVELTSGKMPRISHELAVRLERRHDDSPWHTEVVPFVLLGSLHWKLIAPDGSAYETAFPGNEVNFEEALETDQSGTYKAVTKMRNPREREIQLVVVTTSAVSVRLNGRTVLENSEPASFIPAYHRAPVNRRAMLQLQPGDYELEIEVKKEKGSEPLQLMVLPVSSRKPKQPGSCYYLTDILFLPSAK